MKKLFVFFAMIVMLASCQKEAGSSSNKKTPSVTLGANHISAVSVVLEGKANIGSSAASDLVVGFQYSKSAGILPSNSISVTASDADADYQYSTGISGLEPSTTYYFRSFVRQNNVDTYGETKEFTTKELSSLIETLEPSDINATTAVLNGKIDLTDVEFATKDIEYGFRWGMDENSIHSFLKGGNNTGNKYSAHLTGLSHRTPYYYKAYVIIDGKSFPGDIKSFSTDVVPVEDIVLDKSDCVVNTIGSSFSITATVYPVDATNKIVRWESNNEEVATVNEIGQVTAIGNGVATIVATTEDQNKRAICIVTVSQLATSVSLDKYSISLNEGESQVLSATISPITAYDKTITWISSNESVAIVDGNGRVTAVSKGTTIVKAIANDGSGKTASCNVLVKRPVSSISLNKTSLSLHNDESETLVATVLPVDANDISVTWTSSNPSVAIVSSSGVVLGKTRGFTTISVVANDGSGIKATCDVEVKQYVTNLILDKSTYYTIVGSIETIAVASVLPSDANDKSYSWNTSDAGIVTVDDMGNVFSVSKGTATITATANDGSGTSASCDIIVRNPLPDGAVDLGLSIHWAAYNLGETGLANSSDVLGGYFAWGETATKESYYWYNYSFGGNWSGPFSKYNTQEIYGPVDNKKVLETGYDGDDAASKILGGTWRMPTYNEWVELFDNCSMIWANEDGVNGYKLTATNGNSIFLPATGLKRDKDYIEVGVSGAYWSSSLASGIPYKSLGIAFYKTGLYKDGYFRYYGFAIRPVSE